MALAKCSSRERCKHRPSFWRSPSVPVPGWPRRNVPHVPRAVPRRRAWSGRGCRHRVLPRADSQRCSMRAVAGIFRRHSRQRTSRHGERLPALTSSITTTLIECCSQSFGWTNETLRASLELPAKVPKTPWAQPGTARHSAVKRVA